MERLLAKSKREGCEPKWLPDHTDDVMNAARSLFGMPGRPSRLGRSWLRFFGLAETEGLEGASLWP